MCRAPPHASRTPPCLTLVPDPDGGHTVPCMEAGTGLRAPQGLDSGFESTLSGSTPGAVPTTPRLPHSEGPKEPLAAAAVPPR